MSASYRRSRPSSRELNSQSGYNPTVAASTESRGSKRTKRKPKPLWYRRLKFVLGILFLLFLIACITGFVMLLSARKDASAEIHKFEELAASMQVKPSEIVASDGTVLYQVSGEFREYAPLSEIPKRVQNAMIAAEDVRFYSHDGVDLKALARTTLVDTREGRLKQGASTIEMQLAKLVSSNSEKTWRRKLHDIALAMELSQNMDKDRILELYLNKVYFGSHAYGIKAAADVYFGKPLDKISNAEAAFLVRLVRSPSSWNHLHRKENLDKAIENRDNVLQVMRRANMITEQEYQAAIEEEPKFSIKTPSSSERMLRAPYFVRHVRKVLSTEFPDIRLTDGGYRIETTLDAQMQAIAEREVAKTVAQNRKNKVSTAAFVLMNADGQILAEVGGVDFAKNQYNMIYQGHRQPGSSFKPFVYATALNAGTLHMGDQLANMPTTFPAPPGGEPWSPKNSNSKENSVTTSVRNAFALSMNIPAAHVIDQVGPAEVVRTAHEAFGFVSELQPVLPLALGSDAVNPLEMAQGISVFALRGDRATPYAIKRVVGPEGDTLKEFGPRIVRGVFNPEVCDEVDELMRGVIQYGTGYKARNLVPNARGKTGTTDSNRDAWFVGYTDGLIGVGWVANEGRDKAGKPTYSRMSPAVFGGTVTVDFWAAVMKAAYEKYGSKYAVTSTHEIKNGQAQTPPLEKDVTPLNPEDSQAKMGPPSDDDMGNMPSDGTPDEDTTKATSPADDPTIPPPAEQTKPKATPSPATDTDQYVEVEVCAETGMKASIYCPETVTRKFKKGKEPKRVCTTHTG